MRALVQRVSMAEVVVEGEVIAAIGRGVLIFLAVEKGDHEEILERMVSRSVGLRIFPDEAGRMNLSVTQVGGEMLVVSQFTLAADMKKGFRPSFSRAQEPGLAEAMYERFCQLAREQGAKVAMGRFGADMKVHLVNDGPVTIWLEFTDSTENPNRRNLPSNDAEFV